jgi:hypothetical protein
MPCFTNLVWASSATDDGLLRIRLSGLVPALWCDLAGFGRIDGVFMLDQRQVVRQPLQEKVFVPVPDRHRWPDVDLNRQNVFKLSPLLVQVSDVYGRVAVDLVP